MCDFLPHFLACFQKKTLVHSENQSAPPSTFPSSSPQQFWIPWLIQPKVSETLSSYRFNSDLQKKFKRTSQWEHELQHGLSSHLFLWHPPVNRRWSSLPRQHVPVSKPMAFYNIDIKLIITDGRWKRIYLRKLWSNEGVKAFLASGFKKQISRKWRFVCSVSPKQRVCYCLSQSAQFNSHWKAITWHYWIKTLNFCLTDPKHFILAAFAL